MYQQGISVVVPTEGRLEFLQELLESLTVARTSSPVEAEVIVVDSTQEPDMSRVKEAAFRFGAAYLDGSRDVRAKRNAGVAAARYSVVLFIDSDCQAASDLLAAHWRALAVDDRSVGGAAGLTSFVGEAGPAWRLVEGTSLVAQFSAPTAGADLRWAPCCNLSYKHQVLDEIGPFDTSLPHRLGGDDLDLSLRMTSAGYRLVSCPEAVVHHSRRTWNNMRAVLGRAYRWGRMHYHLLSRHPHARAPAAPSFWVWAILLTLVWTIAAALTHNPFILATIPAWFAASLLLFAVFDAAGAPSGGRARAVGRSLRGAIPELCFVLGTTVESIRHGDPRFIWSRLDIDDDATSMLRAAALDSWSNTIAAALCTLLAVVLAR